MKKTLSAAGIAGVLLILSACKGPDTKQGNTPPDTPLTVNAGPVTPKGIGSVTNGVFTTADYEITVPEGWTEKDQQSNNYRLAMLVAPKKDNFNPNLNILNDNMNGKTLDAYIRFNLEKMATMNLTNQQAGDMVINGINGKYLTYSYSIQGREVAIKTYLIPKNGYMWVLTGSCLISQAAEYVTQFDNIAHTFKLK